MEQKKIDYKALIGAGVVVLSNVALILKATNPEKGAALEALSVALPGAVDAVAQCVGVAQDAAFAFLNIFGGALLFTSSKFGIRK